MIMTTQNNQASLSRVIKVLANASRAKDTHSLWLNLVTCRRALKMIITRLLVITMTKTLLMRSNLEDADSALLSLSLSIFISLPGVLITLVESVIFNIGSGFAPLGMLNHLRVGRWMLFVRWLFRSSTHHPFRIAPSSWLSCHWLDLPRETGVLVIQGFFWCLFTYPFQPWLPSHITTSSNWSNRADSAVKERKKESSPFRWSVWIDLGWSGFLGERRRPFWFLFEALEVERSCCSRMSPMYSLSLVGSCLMISGRIFLDAFSHELHDSWYDGWGLLEILGKNSSFEIEPKWTPWSKEKC